MARVKPLTADIKPKPAKLAKGEKRTRGLKGRKGDELTYEDDPPEELILEVMRRAKEMNLHPRSIEFTNPKKMAHGLWMLGQMMPVSRVRAATGIDYNTIRRMKFDHAATLDKLRPQFARKFVVAVDAYHELLMEKADRLADNPEQLDAISPDRLALTVGIMTDKAAQLSGMAGVVIEHRRGPSIDDAAQMIAAAKARVADKLKSEAIEAEVVE